MWAACKFWRGLWYNRGMNKTANSFGKKTAKSGAGKGNMKVYSSLAYGKMRHTSAAKKAKSSGKKLAPLPKDPWKRFLAHFRWERIKAYWFSKAGAKRIGKIFAACFLLGVIGVGALFVYYKNQLKEIQLNDLTISETVNTYLDRNGEVLWEDKGDSDYRLVVEGDQIADYARKATVAIEDKSFYTHPGVDFSALVRAAMATLSGKGVQGGSTLTQQLVKQIYFSDEAQSANRGGIARKIKELILSIELEKMYSKEQIITMYLNESPYGGRRNGIESAAQTYFGKSAKELNLAESALLAAIPNNPAVLNPYNTAANEALIARQHKVLDDMVDMQYITADEAKAAKEVAILDQILPESSQYAGIKAPHFVLEVRDILEEKYGIQNFRNGGYTIKTTLDSGAQMAAEEAVANGASLRYVNHSDNIALASVDVETSQVIAMVGSVDWNTPIYGEVNATVSSLEPGSTIKPILDYAPLFSMTGDNVYGPGTMWRDENIDSLYCAGYRGSCALRNASGRFYGNLTLRQSLGNSLNINAVKALHTVGIENGLEIAHKLGDKSYCAESGSAGGLSIAIGSGCGVKMIEHANAYASIARGGTAKELVYVLEVKDPSGKVVESWQDTPGERVIDEQVAYELSDVLSDASARSITFGSQANSFGFNVPGVWTASKTGTTTTTNSSVTKDSWMASYSTAIATVVWNGNHDGAGLTSNTNQVVRRVINDYMEKVHKEVYAKEGKWSEGDKPVRPAGIQTLTVGGKTDIWPSWYKSGKKDNVKTEKIMFNRLNNKRAADCTPDSQKIEVEVTTIIDPISGSEMRNVPEPYLYDEIDTCDIPDATATKKPEVKPIAVTLGDTSYTINVEFTKGSYDLVSYRIIVDGGVIDTGSAAAGKATYTGTVKDGAPAPKKVTVEITDAQGNTAQRSMTVGAGS